MLLSSRDNGNHGRNPFPRPGLGTRMHIEGNQHTEVSQLLVACCFCVPKGPNLVFFCEQPIIFKKFVGAPTVWALKGGSWWKPKNIPTSHDAIDSTISLVFGILMRTDKRLNDKAKLSNTQPKTAGGPMIFQFISLSPSFLFPNGLLFCRCSLHRRQTTGAMSQTLRSQQRRRGAFRISASACAWHPIAAPYYCTVVYGIRVGLLINCPRCASGSMHTTRALFVFRFPPNVSERP